MFPLHNIYVYLFIYIYIFYIIRKRFRQSFVNVVNVANFTNLSRNFTNSPRGSIFWKTNRGRFFQRDDVLEELCISERHWQLPRKKLLPLVRLFWGRLPWSKRLPFLGINDSICIEILELAPKMTPTIWCCDVMIL